MFATLAENAGAALSQLSWHWAGPGGGVPAPRTAAYAGQAADGVPVKAPQRRGEAFAALLGDIAVPDVTRRWPAVAQWSRQVPLLAGGQPR